MRGREGMSVWIRWLLTAIILLITFFFGQRAYLQAQTAQILVATFHAVLKEPDTENKKLLLAYLITLDPGNEILQESLNEVANFLEKRKRIESAQAEILSLRAQLRTEKNYNAAARQRLSRKISALEADASMLRQEIKNRNTQLLLRNCAPLPSVNLGQQEKKERFGGFSLRDM